MNRLCLLAMWAIITTTPAFAGIIYTLTPTNRVEDQTSVRITYTVSGAADSGTQDVSVYQVRVFYSPAPLGATPIGIFSNASKAPDGSLWGPSAAGPFLQTSLTPNLTRLSWQTLTTTGGNQTIDTAGGFIGSFDMTWQRPASGAYDAAFGADRISGAYIVGSDPNNSINAQVQSTTGVDTIVSAVPEPSTWALMTLSAIAAAAGLRRRVLQA